MRRSALLTIVLMLVMSGTAQGAARVPGVTGSFSYQFAPAATTFVEIDARDGAVPKGSISYSSTSYPPFWGEVQCLTVVGNDAWISGVITAGTLPEGIYNGWALRLHDGGTPGTEGDRAIALYWWPDLVNAYCAQADRSYDDAMIPLEAGNLAIHPTR